ncbi:hypothetical protein ADL22_12205 [Streptomyces sp. NRRL F-4489]|uniref:hypothetical protein n=1 Tax=Streptomyces sp. NRRL F-4489 TaxID=1609095 RepID=UPI000749DF14|nr:hypothetical protein [Streptomyces sp. NRRL F-4489]KUL44700.1 hypothetical protein ADL22_12205 [Streptomyces sp. NRRL F-4489]
MIEYIKNNPILTRTVVVGLLTALVHFVPALAGVEANEAVIGGLNTLLVLIVGLESRTKVTAKQHVLVDARNEN